VSVVQPTLSRLGVSDHAWWSIPISEIQGIPLVSESRVTFDTGASIGMGPINFVKQLYKVVFKEDCAPVRTEGGFTFCMFEQEPRFNSPTSNNPTSNEPTSNEPASNNPPSNIPDGNTHIVPDSVVMTFGESTQQVSITVDTKALYDYHVFGYRGTIAFDSK
jgi:hypothetical protein